MVGTGALLLSLLVSGALSARILGPADRGYFALLILIPSLVCQIGAMGVSLGLSHFVAGGEVSGLQALRLLQKPIALQVLSTTLIGFVLGFVVNASNPEYVMTSMVVITSAFSVSTFSKEYGLALLQASGRSVLANVMKPLPQVLSAAGIASLYVAGSTELVTLVVVYVAMDVISAIAVAVTTRILLSRDESHASPSQVDGHRIIQFGRAGYLSYLSPLDTFRLDQIYVGIALSPRDLGFYAAGAAFTTIPRALAHSVGLTAAPFLARQRGIDRHLSPKRTALVFGGLAGGVSAITAVIVIAAADWLVPLLFGEPFRPAIPITRVLMLGGFLFAVRRIVVDILRGVGYPGAGLRSEILGLTSFVVLTPLLSELDGAVGVAWAFTVASAVNVGSLLVAQRGLVRKALARD